MSPLAPRGAAPFRHSLKPALVVRLCYQNWQWKYYCPQPADYYKLYILTHNATICRIKPFSGYGN